MVRLLCKEDFTNRGIATDGKWPPLDALMMAGKVAYMVLEEEDMKKGGKVERFKREKSLKKPLTDITIIDVFKQERLAREKAFKKPITDSNFDLHANKPKREFKKEVEEEDGLEFKNKNEKTGLKRKYVDSEDDSEWGEELKAKKSSNKTSKKKNSGSDNKRSKRSPKKDAPKCPLPPPPMPENMKDVITHMNGTNMVFVIQKPLYKSDTKINQNRLSIPFNQIKRENFLTREEMELLNNRVDMPTTVVEPSLKISNDVVFRQWDMNKASGKTNSNYVLKSGWNKVRERNGLKMDDIVQLWSFRVQGKLCFALFRVSEGVNSENDSQTREDNNNGSGSGSGSGSSGSENGASTSQSGVGVQSGSGCIGDGSGASTTSPNSERNGSSSKASCNGSIESVGSFRR